MGTRVASILAEIGIDSSKFTSGSKGVMSGIKDMLGGLGKIGPIAGIATAAFGILVDQLNKAEQAAVESAKVDAKLEAVLKSTGNAAGLTADQLDEYATAISKASGLDDELVKNGEAVLATFTKISGGEFKSAMQAAVDMSAVLGTDLQGSIVQVGKSMNDFSGYTALKRAGVSFTGEQMAQIAKFKEMNDLVGYQQMLLAELSTEFGGAASAINAAGDGSENLKVAVGNLQEAIGEGLIPVKRRWNELMTEVADGLTNTVEAANDNKTAMQELNMEYFNGVGYVKDGVRVTAEYGNELLTAHNHIKIVGQALNEMYGAGQDAASGISELIGVTEEFDDAIIPVTAHLQDYTTELLFNQAAAGLDAGASLALAESLGLVDKNTSYAMGKLQGLRDQLSATGDVDGYTAAVARLDEQMRKLESKELVLTLLGIIDPTAHAIMGYTGASGISLNLSKGVSRQERAGGGPVMNGTPYLVGENGPEMFVPNSGGKIVPNNQLQGGGMGGGVDYYTLARAVAEAFVTMGIGR